MIRTDVDRINVGSDQEWETNFIPWMEEKISGGLGKVDGFFVATFDSNIRSVQPHTEQRFLDLCVPADMNNVVKQTFRRFPNNPHLFNYNSYDANSQSFDNFKEEARHLQSYTHDTCCSQLLNEGDLDKLMIHFETDVLMNGSNRTCGKSDSRVVLLESAQKLVHLHKEYSQDTSRFLWEKRLKTAPKVCPEKECEVVGHCDSSVKEDHDYESELYYGFGTNEPVKEMRITEKLSLGRIYNLLWLLPYHYPGVQTPYTYYASTHSMFPLHIEDALLYSVNYMFMGHPKIWVIVPPRATALLEFHLRQGAHMNDSKCANIQGHKNIVPTVRWMKDHNIPFKICIQKPGDLIVLLPSAPHYGFSAGRNICQAVNLATISWLATAVNLKKCNCIPYQVHMDIKPLIAAFRPDLLSSLLNGKVVLTQDALNGMQLLHQQIRKNCHIAAHLPEATLSECHVPQPEGPVLTYHCPVSACTCTFSDSTQAPIKNAIIRHVRSCHGPVLQSENLLLKVSLMFAAKKRKTSDTKDS